MPWKTADVEKFVKGLNDVQKKTWVKVANKALKDGEKEKQAIAHATAIAKQVKSKSPIAEAGVIAYDVVNTLMEYREAEGAAVDQALSIVEGICSPVARVTYDRGKNWVPLKEVKQTGQVITEEIKESVKSKLQQDYADTGQWPWIKESFSDIIVVQNRDKEQGTCSLHECRYVVNPKGDVTLGEFREVKEVLQFEPVRETEDLEESKDMLEMAEAFIPLTEGKNKPVIGPDGRVKLKLIKPGWGESAYYDTEVLERDAKIFEGAKMFWNHPTKEEEKNRPEGDLNNLAAVIESTPKYEQDGPRGAGVYAHAKVFDRYKEPIEELAPHIGVSIRAAGKGKKGTIDGREGLVAEAITHRKSVDFVTEPGAGGEILDLFEAAGRRKKKEDTSMALDMKELTLEQLKESRQDLVDALLKESRVEQKEDKEEQVENESLIEAQRKIEKLEEKLLLGSAKEEIMGLLSEAKLPARTKSRLFRESLLNVPTKEDGELDLEKLEESVKALITEAQEEISEISESGRIRGMGSSGSSEKSEEEITKDLSESFKTLLGDEGRAKSATEGR